MDGGTKKRQRGASSAHEKQKKRPKVQYSPSRYPSTSPESEIEELCMPTFLAASNFPLDVTTEEVKKFFKYKAKDVKLHKFPNEKGKIVDVHCLIEFPTAKQATQGLKRNGKMLRQKSIYVARQGNDRKIVCVSEFPGKAKKKMTKRLTIALTPYGEVLNIYLPTNSTTRRCLGFGYIYMEENDEKLPTSIKINDIEVTVRPSTMKKLYLPELLDKQVLETEGTILKKMLLPISDGLHNLSAKTLSWEDNGRDIIPETINQELNDCWAIALRSHYNSLMKILKIPGRDLTRDQLIKGVGPAHVVSGEGIDRLKHVFPFMKSIGCDMQIFNRPKGNNVELFEAFERRIEKLLKKAPVMVSIECSPGFLSFNGEGIYLPTDIDIYQRTFEKFPLHCLLLTGYGREDGKQYWRLQDSQGENWGDKGFIKIERHKCIIKSVVKLKVKA